VSRPVRIAKIVAATIGIPLFLYLLLATLLSLIPVNRHFRSSGPVEIYVCTNGLHADFLLPVADPVIDWRSKFPVIDFAGADSSYQFVGIGWGDRRFYMETPYWEDLQLSVALTAALWPTRAALHVTYYPEAPDSEDCVKLRLTEDQYSRLSEFILSYFPEDTQTEGALIPGKGYGPRDNFYEARGRFSALFTCNNWVSKGLKRAGVRTALWSPFDKGIFWQLSR
jgi:uncharacterized protein (TIGR02117 family)